MTGEGASAFFFDEWSRRRPGERRDLRRARLLADRLALPVLPTLTVVGSKGKGTAATYASAWLAAAGCRVVTVTSPGLRRDTDRIRLDGAAIRERELETLGGRLRDAARSLPPRVHGYLSPSGLFTLAGLLYAGDSGADVVVLEAGMGGVSDEVSLVPPTVVAVTEVFGEHLGILGDSPAQIAVDKAGVAAETTAAVVSLSQVPDVAAAITATVVERTGRAPEILGSQEVGGSEGSPFAGRSSDQEASGAHKAAHRPIHTDHTDHADHADHAGHADPRTPTDVRVRPAQAHHAAVSAPQAPAPRAAGASPDPRDVLPLNDVLPSGLAQRNALLGLVAARRLLEATGRPGPDAARAAEVLASVRLPGRASWHEIPGATVLVDSAVERNGAAAALAEAYRRWDRVDHVLVCLPDHKDLPGVLAALDGLPVTTVRMPDRESLEFARTPDAVDIADVTRERLAAYGPKIVVLGTVYFTGRILDLVGAGTTRLFEV